MSELTLENFVATAAEAEAAGLEVLVATSSQLFLDLDTEEGRKQYEEFRHRVFATYQADTVESWKSKGGNDHKLISLSSVLDLPTRVALQLLLGSDPVKEFLTLARLRYYGEDTGLVRLFRPPGPIVKEETLTQYADLGSFDSL